jgi:agmatine/peptidylarginine deiminase
MRNSLRPALATLSILLACICSAAAADADARPRVPAEWEPALGALVSWPPIVPDALLIEIARDDRLFVMVDSPRAQAEAEAALTKLGIDRRAVDFIVAPSGDAHSYTRDWGPPAVFDESGVLHLADPRFVDYPMTTPGCDTRLYSQRVVYLANFADDDAATAAVARTLNLPVLELPFAFTGGNALMDGHGTAFSTCVMLNENRRYLGISRDEFLKAVETRLGLSRYVIVPNFEWFGIQHIDCLLKPLDEETLLVKRIPEDHPDHESIEAIVRYLAALKGPYGRPYRILRIDTPTYKLGYFVASYTNSLILNHKVLVPLFGIPADAKALEIWRQAMPGYKVIGFENRERYGWNWTDALHCRVRALWDPQMLYMSHRRIDDRVEAAESYPLEVLIRDYSRKGLIPQELKLSWRLGGETGWRQTPLRAGPRPDLFVGSLPGPAAGATVEYYLSAADRSGRRESLPRVAPAAVYSFSVIQRAR